MKKLALLFPGQGSQHVGMGHDLCNYFPVANRAFEEASDELHQDFKALCFDGELSELTRTENAQPAILTLSIAKYRVYCQELDIVPVLSAGHSLGEYSALVCAGSIPFREALRLVKRRGELMRDASLNAGGGMAAVTGPDKSIVEAQCRAVDSETSRVVVANVNSASQTVISGHGDALEEVSKRLSQQKGTRVVPLKVSAAFHSPLMEHSAQLFEEELSKYTFKVPRWPVVSNVNAKPYEGGESIPILLKEQITSPILWFDIMELMFRQEIDVAIELGPKKVLKNLFKRHQSSSNQNKKANIKIYSTNTQTDLQELGGINPDDFIDRRPNPLERCLAMAVSTPNLNFDDEAYQAGVVEPYRKIKEMCYALMEEKKEPEPEQLEEATALLKQIFETKQVPQEEQERRFKQIFEETDAPV